MPLPRGDWSYPSIVVSPVIWLVVGWALIWFTQVAHIPGLGSYCRSSTSSTTFEKDYRCFMGTWVIEESSRVPAPHGFRSVKGRDRGFSMG